MSKGIILRNSKNILMEAAQSNEQAIDFRKIKLKFEVTAVFSL